MTYLQKLDEISASDFPGNCNCSLLRRASRRVSRYYDNALAGTGLRSTQYTLLGFLASEGAMSIAHLAERMTLDRATTGHNLRPLERDGLVRIDVCENDKRVRDVSITKRGAEIFLNAHPAWTRAQNGFEAAFGKEESLMLRKAMSQVISVPIPNRS